MASTSLIDYWQGRDGEHAFLEEVEGEAALSYVKELNSECLTSLSDPISTPLYSRILAILNNKEKIPYVRKIGPFLYNFWKDEEHIRGLWRRTSLESYVTSNPTWETVLDLDALGREEGESWVYKGHKLCDLDMNVDPSRTLLMLSRGGSDATVIREFDLISKTFVPPENGGFVVPEAKSRVSWLTPDVLLIGTNFDALTPSSASASPSLTSSGYPRTIHRWLRGTALSASVCEFEGEVSDVSVGTSVTMHAGHVFEWRTRAMTFYTSKKYVRRGDSDSWHELSIPEDAETSQFLDQMLISLRSDWTVISSATAVSTSYTSGSLLAVDITSFMHHGTDAAITVLFEPSARVSLDSYTELKSRLLLHVLDNVKSQIWFWTYDGDRWQMQDKENEGVIRGASMTAYDSDHSDQYWLTTSTFLQPSRLHLADASLGVAGIAAAVASPLKSLPCQFDTSGLIEEQRQAPSADGTLIPYFIIRPQGMSGPRKTLLYGYGGFEISLTPYYPAVTGAGWLSNGGVYVLANIRGGGEFGPQWHQAALKENRCKAYDDFIAVAEHLVTSGITTSKQLAIQGGSNGGLLMGNMITRRPDLFGGVVCQVPLLDMKRYSHLLAGASWMAEYGNPDVEEEWEYLKRYSAYHNIAKDGAAYPPIIVLTSTKDDRVHPYHARSFVKRLRDVGAPHVLYYENIEGGHGGAADNKQQAFMTCLYMQFLDKTVGV